jgi:hypothetical protein
LQRVYVILGEVLDGDGLRDALPASVVIPHIPREMDHEQVDGLDRSLHASLALFGCLQPGRVSQLRHRLEEVSGEHAAAEQLAHVGELAAHPVPGR